VEVKEMLNSEEGNKEVKEGNCQRKGRSGCTILRPEDIAK